MARDEDTPVTFSVSPASDGQNAVPVKKTPSRAPALALRMFEELQQEVVNRGIQADHWRSVPKAVLAEIDSLRTAVYDLSYLADGLFESGHECPDDEPVVKFAVALIKTLDQSLDMQDRTIKAISERLADHERASTKDLDAADAYARAKNDDLLSMTANRDLLLGEVGVLRASVAEAQELARNTQDIAGQAVAETAQAVLERDREKIAKDSAMELLNREREKSAATQNTLWQAQGLLKDARTAAGLDEEGSESLALEIQSIREALSEKRDRIEDLDEELEDLNARIKAYFDENWPRTNWITKLFCEHHWHDVADDLGDGVTYHCCWCGKDNGRVLLHDKSAICDRKF